MRKLFLWALVLGALAPLPGVCAAASKVTPANVTIQTSDGVALTGTFWGQEKKAPTVLLLHMVGGQRSDWDAFGSELAAVGMTVLAIDFRGHGQSRKQGDHNLDQADFNEKDWRGLLTDASASLDWLAGQKGADASRMGIVGGSIGANTALIAGSTDKRVKTVVLLSPGLDYHGLKTEHAIEQYGTRSSFLVASEDDEASARAVKRLGSLARGRSATKLFKAAGHGIRMFAAEPTLDAQVAGWLKENL